MPDIYTINCNSTGYSLRDNSKSAVTLNGTSCANSTASFYAPITAGEAGEVLLSNGSGAPSWTVMSWLVAENPFFYQFDGTGYTIGAKFDATPESGSANLMNSASIYNTLFGYTTSGKNYSIRLDNAGHAYVNVPWTDTKTYLNADSTGNYFSKSYTSPAVITSLAGGTYGAIYSISCTQLSEQGRIYVNSANTTYWSPSTYTEAYVGYSSDALVPGLLNMCVVVPASGTKYLVGQYVTKVFIQGIKISG